MLCRKKRKPYEYHENNEPFTAIFGKKVTQGSFLKYGEKCKSLPIHLKKQSASNSQINSTLKVELEYEK